MEMAKVDCSGRPLPFDEDESLFWGILGGGTGM